MYSVLKRATTPSHDLNCLDPCFLSKCPVFSHIHTHKDFGPHFTDYDLFLMKTWLEMFYKRQKR